MLPPTYKTIGNTGGEFREGLLQLEGSSGQFVNNKGEVVIDQKYWSVSGFSEGLAAAAINGKTGYIDRSGKYVIQPTFLDGMDFQDGFARVVIKETCKLFTSGPCVPHRIVGIENQAQLLSE